MKTAERMMGIVGRRVAETSARRGAGVLSIRSWLGAAPADGQLQRPECMGGYSIGRRLR